MRRSDDRTGMEQHPGSFRDPAGYVFLQGGDVYRALLLQGAADFQLTQSSGLARELIEEGLLIPHEEVGIEVENNFPSAVRILRTERIQFYSYPYEWCFSQLRDAALLTLTVLRKALEKGLTLKDASAYNVSFIGARPIFTDILSFTKYQQGSPWAGYLQFCEHFLVPLLLSCRAGRSVSSLLRTWNEGVPLEVGSSLLRGWSGLRPGELLHIHLHARSIRRHLKHDASKRGSHRQSKHQTLALVDSLKRVVRRLEPPADASLWLKYYGDTIYSPGDTMEKERILKEWIARANPSRVWDLGSNTGRYARLASERGIPTIAMDADDACVDSTYREARSRADSYLTPLVMNLANPSPSLGWAHNERASLADRGPADLVLYLGIIHHMRFTYLIPLAQQLAYLAKVGKNVIVEWVPEDDPNCLHFSAHANIKSSYSTAIFESLLDDYCSVIERCHIGSTNRELFWLQMK